MPPRARELDVWMNGERVGRWFANRQGTPVFQYTDEWLRSPRVRPLSLSLPIVPGNEPHTGDRVVAWFDNLLPDSTAIRERIRSRFRAESTQAFDLLAAIGRDCVGAVQIIPEGESPGDVRRIEAQPISDADVARLLRGVTSQDVAGTYDYLHQFRISLAGAQEKFALTRIGEQWYQPHGATPTTHILKLPLGLVGNMRSNMRDSVENEWLCMRLLGEWGLPVARTEIGTFADAVSEEKVLVVERFDRERIPPTGIDPEWILRLPQEDFCQATGTPAWRKYESDGGPGILACMGLVQAGEQPTLDSLVFAKAQLAFWLLAAPDGHAKNFSIFLRRDGYVMTPLYDVLSAWPIVGGGANELAEQKVTLAMALRGKRPHRHIRRITAQHWRQLAARTGAPDAFDQMIALVEATESVLSRVDDQLPAPFPPYVRDRVASGVRKQRAHFMNGLGSRADVT